MKQKGTLLICKPKGSATQPGKLYYQCSTHSYIMHPDLTFMRHIIPIKSSTYGGLSLRQDIKKFKMAKGTLHAFYPYHLLQYLTAHVLLHELTAWNRVLLGRLTVTQLLNKFPAFYGMQHLIATFTNQPLDQILSNMNPVNALPSFSFKIHFSIILPPISPVASSLQVFQLKFCMHFPYTPSVLYIPPISFSLV
jgi:hypothetical protein